MKDIIKAFFLEDNSDKTLANIKVDNYIDKIKNSTFEQGIKEIRLFINIYNLNINLYKITYINEYIYD